jgi:formylglycine-generating enzyme required for sulfatase activity
MPLSPGQVLNQRYRIVSLLGQGGFGAVYRAWDINMECPRALKENLDTSPEAGRQFKREAKILGQLTHQNLPHVIDHFIIPSQGQYLVMDYVEGEDLQQMLMRAGGPLPEAQVLEWVGQVCDALDYLHHQTPPIIHRDIKPANIKITPGGRAMLVDFGIAKIYDTELATTVGARAVTPGFSPPEQYGQGATNAQSDIYALGATCYALLTGRPAPESVHRIGNDPLAHPQQLNPGLSPRTAGVLLQAMQTDPARRLRSAAEFKARLSEPQATAPPTATPTVRTAKPPRSGKLLWGLIGLTGLIVVVGVLLAGYLFNRLVGAPKAAGLQATSTHTPIPGVGQTAEPSSAPATASPEPSPEPVYKAGDTRLSAQDGSPQIYIPAGEFIMGSTEVEAGLSFDQTPKHQVALSAYWIDRYEVSNSMYQACVAAGACRAPVTSASSTRKHYYGNPDYGGYPVVWVTWEDAFTYCGWAGRRLPSEAEWERAARGDNGLSNYPWGSLPPTGEQANYCDANCGYDWKDNQVDDGFEDASPVDYFSSGASLYGLLNMAGNVWEWVYDFYAEDYYRNSPLKNPFGPETGTERVLRGGSFESSAEDIRSANRFHFSQDAATSSFGFRCVQDAR